MDRVELISILIGAATVLLVALIAFFGRPVGRRLRRMVWAGGSAEGGEAAEPGSWFGSGSGHGSHCDFGSHSGGDCGHGGGDGGGGGH
jgi:hypothetical protein